MAVIQEYKCPCCGDLPMDKGAYRRYLFGAMAIGAAAVYALQYLIWLL